MSLDFHKPLTAKKMKKRKELDALVSSDKLSAKYTSASSANGGVSGGVNHRLSASGNGGGAVGRKISRGAHQLLEESGSNSENEIPQGDMSGDGDVYAQLGERRFRRRQHATGCGSCGRNCVSFLGVCSFLLAVACIAGVAALAWMQMELKRELSLLRDQIQHAGEKESGVDGELIDVKNKVGALSTKEAADAKTLASLQTTMTETRQAVEEVKSSMTALKKSVASASELDNLPRELQSLKKEVATVGSNVASLRDETKKTASSVTELKTKVEALEKKVTSDAAKGGNVDALNDSVTEVKSAAEKLTRTVFGDGRGSGINSRLEALSTQMEELHGAVEEIRKARGNDASTDQSEKSAGGVATTQPTPVQQNIIISAQPHEVTGVVGETTTSSSPASEVASTSIVQRSNAKEELTHIKDTLAANRNKNPSTD